jgi:hypothetical protein
MPSTKLLKEYELMYNRLSEIEIINCLKWLIDSFFWQTVTLINNNKVIVTTKYHNNKYIFKVKY